MIRISKWFIIRCVFGTLYEYIRTDQFKSVASRVLGPTRVKEIAYCPRPTRCVPVPLFPSIFQRDAQTIDFMIAWHLDNHVMGMIPLSPYSAFLSLIFDSGLQIPHAIMYVSHRPQVHHSLTLTILLDRQIWRSHLPHWLL